MSPIIYRALEGGDVLPFEAPLRELDEQIEALRRSAREADLDAADALASERADVRRRIYANLTPWDRVCLARHPGRPTADDYLAGMCDDCFELRGDRRSADDPAMFAGLANVGGRRIVIIADRKGHAAGENRDMGFGMAKPEGYRKALRAMKLAEKFGLPVVSLIDTPGASPTIDAEDRGQAQAIAENLAAMSQLRTPILSLIVGEGGSAGALAIGMADWLGLLENAYYTVVSPEGAAAVLWHDPERAADAAQALKLTAHELVELGIADDVIAEPFSAAHMDKLATVECVREALIQQVDRFASEPVDDLLARRYAHYRHVGVAPNG